MFLYPGFSFTPVCIFRNTVGITKTCSYNSFCSFTRASYPGRSVYRPFPFSLFKIKKNHLSEEASQLFYAHESGSRQQMLRSDWIWAALRFTDPGAGPTRSVGSRHPFTLLMYRLVHNMQHQFNSHRGRVLFLLGRSRALVIIPYTRRLCQ